MWSHEAAPFGFTTLAGIQNGMSVALLDMLVGGDAAQFPHGITARESEIWQCE
jgi:hypothetical protein